jgi:hypothetical protein
MIRSAMFKMAAAFPYRASLQFHISNQTFLRARSFSQKTPGVGLAFFAGSSPYFVKSSIHMRLTKPSQAHAAYGVV